MILDQFSDLALHKLIQQAQSVMVATHVSNKLMLWVIMHWYVSMEEAEFIDTIYKKALDKYYQHKIRKYGANCERKNIEYIPLIAETTSCWHRDAVAIFKIIANIIADKENKEISIAIEIVYKAFSVALQKGNLCPSTPIATKLFNQNFHPPLALFFYFKIFI
ncbi:hypothetical protein RFI_02242 [Reticulomyxa filosa]|uniref:Uncharacterized protein n=1 Tax=Reticulomyxa filosa TaxID=46433 RepID=X6P9K0_RETFI|nr:hypothetical protein RFI_02242 [Reticulomyxa filosa]|eukprot:ETO34846.1 hypothetical protein RFI_02242 [Reticulomyxa filosa]